MKKNWKVLIGIAIGIAISLVGAIALAWKYLGNLINF